MKIMKILFTIGTLSLSDAAAKEREKEHTLFLSPWNIAC